MLKDIMFRFVVAIAIGFLSFAPGAIAEENSIDRYSDVRIQESVITLDLAIESALNFNPNLQALRENAGIARSDIILANTFTNPEALMSIQKGPTRDPAPKIELELEKRMKIGSWWFNRKSAKAGYEAALKEIQSAEQDLIREVKTSFYSLLSLEQTLELAAETVELNNEFVKTASSRFKRGEVSEVEVNILEIEKDSSLQEEKRIKAEYLQEGYRFKYLLGLTSEVEVSLQGKLFDGELDLERSELLLFGLENRPDLLAARKRIEVMQAQKTLAKVEALPSVTVGFRYDQESDGEDSYGAIMGIDVPIFDQNRARIVETKSLLLQAKSRLIATQSLVIQEIETTYSALGLIKDQIDIYENKIQPKLEKTLEVYKTAYKRGQVSIFEIMISKRQYIQTKANYLRTLNEYARAVADLEKVVGGKLEVIKEWRAK